MFHCMLNHLEAVAWKIALILCFIQEMTYALLRSHDLCTVKVSIYVVPHPLLVILEKEPDISSP